MKRQIQTVPRAAVAFVAGLTIAAAVSARGPKQRTPRTVTPFAPIAQLIRPDDTDVTIFGGPNRPLSAGAPAGISVVAWEMQGCGALIIRLKPGRSEITPNGRWITTSWTAKVDDVLRQIADHPIDTQEELQFVQDGGDVAIGSTSVHARLEWARTLMPGERYLVLPAWDKAAQAIGLSPSREYRLTSTGGLERVDTMSNRLSAMTAQQLEDAIRSLGGGGTP